MTVFDYNGLAAKALGLLTRFGQDITLRKLTPGAYDKATGTVTGSSSADSTLKGALFDFSAGATQRNLTIIPVTDKQLLLQAGAAVPALNDTIITADGQQWGIQDIKTIGPAGTPVIYDLHVRRS